MSQCDCSLMPVVVRAPRCYAGGQAGERTRAVHGEGWALE
jgi:hypothetical protein